MCTMMISGTQNEIICPRTYFKVTIMFRIAFVKPVPSFALRASPARIPITTPTRSLNGRLLKKTRFFHRKNPPILFFGPNSQMSVIPNLSQTCLVGMQYYNTRRINLQLSVCSLPLCTYRTFIFYCPAGQKNIISPCAFLSCF